MMGPGSGATININAGQVVDGDVVSFIVDWDDGTAPEPVVPVKTGANTWEALGVLHYFPVNGPNVQCRYIPSVTLLVNGIICTINFGTPPIFNRWNVDNENSGRLELTETITNVNEYLVCRGTETTVTFTDRSTLNCVPPELPPVNIGQRWRRFTYGTANTITSATGVEVNGVIEAYPFQGAVITANPSQNPLPPTVTLPITVPADAQVGEIFEITMEYWNTCNPFPGSAPVTLTARIRVVDQPLPPTPVSRVYCTSNALQPFEITVAGNPIVNWYEDNAGVPGNLITQGASKTLPTSAYPPSGINNTTAGVYTVWASYYGVNNVDGVSCESPRVPVTITIREFMPRPPIPTGASQFCNGSTFMLSLPPPATETIGGTTEYIWIADAGVTISSTTATTATFNINITNFGGADFVDRTLGVRRRYTTIPNCGSATRDIPIRIYAPTVGGTLSAVPDICQGSDAGTITLSGHRGQVQRWEVSFNGGAFVPDGSLGTGISINPGMLGIGTWAYRAVVANAHVPKK
ncbi:MAG: hypothetical protein HC859_04990 [Bacteroidia bacterium]|nr:hypothetical protein [Bacteroidia bacterium]